MRSLFTLILLLSILQGCSPDVGEGRYAGHPEDICARTTPFAEGVVREITSQVNVALSQRNGGPAAGIQLGHADVQVTNLRLANTSIYGDDGVSVECQAHWSATIALRPTISERYLYERSEHAVTSCPQAAGRRPKSSEIFFERVDEVKRQSVNARNIRLQNINAPDYRALWNKDKRSIYIYGDMGVPPDLADRFLLGPVERVALLRSCVAVSGRRQQRAAPQTVR